MERSYKTQERVGCYNERDIGQAKYPVDHLAIPPIYLVTSGGVPTPGLGTNDLECI